MRSEAPERVSATCNTSSGFGRNVVAPTSGEQQPQRNGAMMEDSDSVNDGLGSRGVAAPRPAVSKWKPRDRFFYVYAGAYIVGGDIISAGPETATVHYDNFDGKYRSAPLATLFKTKRAARKRITRTP